MRCAEYHSNLFLLHSEQITVEVDLISSLPLLQDFRWHRCTLPSHGFRNYSTFFLSVSVKEMGFDACIFVLTWTLNFALTEKNKTFLKCVYIQYLLQLHIRKGTSHKGHWISLHPKWTLSQRLYISIASARIVSLLSTADHLDTLWPGTQGSFLPLVSKCWPCRGLCVFLAHS